MDLFLVILILLCLIGISNILHRLIPFVPVPLIQIVLGYAVAYLPSGIHLPLNPDLFFVLFVAPLLFNDGKRIPREQLWELRLPILLLALGLVFATVFVLGYIVHWLVPSIPLSAAFAIAAILSPTDAIAVSALAGRNSLPKNLMHLLEGEALMNDASGLVAFKFAIAATVTGFFSLSQATASFLLIAVGGLLSGIVLSFILIRMRLHIRRWGMEDVTTHMLIQILTPFFIYLVAEEAGVSGILAVVAGGIIHAIERDHAESVIAKLQVVSVNTWSVILFILNGMVFLILGLQIPDVAAIIFRDNSISNGPVIADIIVISISLLSLRFVWNYLFWNKNWISGQKDLAPSRLRSVLLISFSGVRGTISLAGALSIPFVLQDGSPFPERSLIIFLAAGVILFTLIAASIMLPFLAKKNAKSAGPDHETLEHMAHRKIIQSVIQTLRDEMKPENQAATLSVIFHYEKLMKQPLQNRNFPKIPSSEHETAVRMIGLRAEQAEAEYLLETEQISRDTAYHLEEHINAMEAALSHNIRFNFFLVITVVKRYSLKLFSHNKKTLKTEVQEFRFAKIQTSKAAIAAIREQINEETRLVSLDLIGAYHKAIERLSLNQQHSPKRKLLDTQKKELQLKAIVIARNEVQALFESDEISREVANALRQSINYLEATLLDE